MDAEAAARTLQTNLRHTFAKLNSNSNLETEDKACSEDEVPASLLSLLNFAKLQRLQEVIEETHNLQNEQQNKPFLKTFDKVEKVVDDGVKLSEQVANCLKYMHDVSQILQQVLKDPMAQDALPLPHHLHRKSIDMLEACVWMIQNQRWNPVSHEVEWETLLPKLSHEVSNWMMSSKLSEKHLKEVEDLKWKLDSLLSNLPNVKS